jgi:steroid delta-isomerase-like uncharacterized protein
MKRVASLAVIGLVVMQCSITYASVTLEDIVTKTVTKYLDAWNEHDMIKVGDLYVDNVVLYDLPTNSSLTGKEEVVKLETEIWLGSSPDMTWVRSGELYVSGNTAIYEWIWTGTYNGSWGDIEIKNKKFVLPGLSMTKVDENGFIYEQRDYYDMYSFQNQLGLVE